MYELVMTNNRMVGSITITGNETSNGITKGGLPTILVVAHGMD